jgi:hydroxycarboxylate dehydrogenase B
LALMCELLGGSLTGNGATGLGRRFANGMFSLYVDPARVDPSHIFDDDVTRYLDWFKQAKPIPGQTILTPGEPERASRAKRLAEGCRSPRRPGKPSPPPRGRPLNYSRSPPRTAI